MTQNSALSCWVIQHLYSRISLFPCLIYVIQKQLWRMFAVCWILRVELSRTHTCPTHPPALNSSIYWQRFLTVLFPSHLYVNVSSLSCILELSARSASAVLRHQRWMALLHCCLSLPDSHLLHWLFWSLMKIEFNSYFKKNEVLFRQSDVTLHQFYLR